MTMPLCTRGQARRVVFRNRQRSAFRSDSIRKLNFVRHPLGISAEDQAPAHVATIPAVLTTASSRWPPANNNTASDIDADCARGMVSSPPMRIFSIGFAVEHFEGTATKIVRQIDDKRICGFRRSLHEFRQRQMRSREPQIGIAKSNVPLGLDQRLTREARIRERHRLEPRKMSASSRACRFRGRDISGRSDVESVRVRFWRRS